MVITIDRINNHTVYNDNNDTNIQIFAPCYTFPGYAYLHQYTIHSSASNNNTNSHISILYPSCHSPRETLLGILSDSDIFRTNPIHYMYSQLITKSNINITSNDSSIKKDEYLNILPDISLLPSIIITFDGYINYNKDRNEWEICNSASGIMNRNEHVDVYMRKELISLLRLYYILVSINMSVIFHLVLSYVLLYYIIGYHSTSFYVSI